MSKGVPNPPSAEPINPVRLDLRIKAKSLPTGGGILTRDLKVTTTLRFQPPYNPLVGKTNYVHTFSDDNLDKIRHEHIRSYKLG